MKNISKNKDIVFRRIKGRIVPIKKQYAKKLEARKQRTKRGLTLLGGAAVLSTGGGIALRKPTRGALVDLARMQSALKRGRPGLAAKRYRRAKKLARGVVIGRRATFAISGGMAVAGLSQLLSKPTSGRGEAAKEFALNVGQIAVTSAFLLGAGKFGIRGKARKAIQKGFRILWKGKK